MSTSEGTPVPHRRERHQLMTVIRHCAPHRSQPRRRPECNNVGIRLASSCEYGTFASISFTITLPRRTVHLIRVPSRPTFNKPTAEVGMPNSSRKNTYKTTPASSSEGSQPQGLSRFACIHRVAYLCGKWVYQNGAACEGCIVRQTPAFDHLRYLWLIICFIGTGPGSWPWEAEVKRCSR